ncbi:thioredoxin-like [Sebastes umbrosus]|uniref:thioredoxin-like n=1 Tax=Sebastes umbrosus TaxID=72105 RepID=UPI00189D4F87|nr:thioredoxin-like [Sebastes umbrosus]
MHWKKYLQTFSRSSFTSRQVHTAIMRQVTTLEEFQAILEEEAGDKLVAVDFTATWCGPCQMIGPKFEDMEKKSDKKKVIFLKVDVDQAPDIAEKYGVQAMPTFIFFKNGKKVGEVVGASEEKLKDKMKALSS